MMRATTSALCAGLFVLACCFGAPDANSATRVEGVEVDAHSDGTYDGGLVIALGSAAPAE